MLRPMKIIRRLVRRPPKPEQQPGEWHKAEPVYHLEFTRDQHSQSSRPWIEPGRVMGWMDRGRGDWMKRDRDNE